MPPCLRGNFSIYWGIVFLIIKEDAMYLQEILEVAIGLVFVWLVLSVATMSLQEWLGNILNSRAKEMEKAIAQMLSSEDLTRQFYEHPLIANLYAASQKTGKKARLPSYIPASQIRRGPVFTRRTGRDG